MKRPRHARAPEDDQRLAVRSRLDDALAPYVRDDAAPAPDPGVVDLRERFRRPPVERLEPVRAADRATVDAPELPV